MIDLKKFSGVMDTDSPNQSIGQSSIKMGRNIRYRGVPGNYEIQNVEGTTLITYNQPTGTNEGMGGFYDDLRHRIFGFIYNSTGLHSIRILYLDDLSIINLLTNGTNADSDCLDFDLDEPISAVKMLYGDEEQGDTLYFNNSSKQPCQINIERTLAGTYGTMTRDFLEVIKYPANRPPYVTYGDDATVTVNTLRKKLFRFMTRPIYYSREKSVVSQKSELPLPINAFDTNIDKDPTKNCKISIVYETLGADVEKIEILGQVSGKTDANGVLDPNAFGDPFLIQTIDKAAFSLNNNDIATFVFYNDQAYSEIDPTDAIQLFDLVPLEANSLEFLNGNVAIYGGITEGFDLITMTATTTSSSIPEKDTQLPYIFVGSQSGDSAFGDSYVAGGINSQGVIHLVLIGAIQIGYSFTVITTNHTLTVVAAGASTNDVLTQLSVAAALAGFTLSVVADSQNLYIGKVGEILQMVVRSSPILTVTDGPAYNWNDKIAFGINYFDKGGRTAGAQTIQAMSVQTVNYTETLTVPNIPQILLSVTNRPPEEAFYFTIGRTNSLAKLKFLYWISDTTFKDTEFAWVSIANLNAFIEKNKPNSNHLAYDYAPGDRIRFIKVLSGSVNTVYVNQDFEIVGQQLSPIINSVQRTGQFIKIALPTTSGTFDFGTSAFFNYEIEIYTPAQSIANSLNKYYEFGERYTIGNPGTATRYHQGMTQNQTSNLSQPATFTFNKGDVYYRRRQINVGAEYVYHVDSYEQNAGRTTMGLSFVSQTYVDPNITPGSSPNQNLVGFNIGTNTDRAILNVSTGTYNFRCKGSISVAINDFGEDFSFYLQDSASVKTYLVPVQHISQGPHIFPFDVTFQMTGPLRMFILAWSEQDNVNSKTYVETDIKITRELPFTVPVMDANYSDFFESGVNSNGRPTIEQPESKRAYNPVLLRWGRPNVINTNINEVSRFTVINFDEIDNQKGDIMVLLTRTRILEVIQKRACGWFGIYYRVLKGNDGKDVLVSSDDILTRNNIQYLQGDYGTSQKNSVIKSKNGYYFNDTVLGCEVRRAENGLTNLNEKYLGQYTISQIITNYNDPYLRTNGAISKIISYYDFFEENYTSIYQEGSLNGNTIPNEMISFNETRNAFCSFNDEPPEWIICAQDKTFEWKAGQIYIRNNTTKYGERFGVQTYPSVTLVFNDKEAVKKVFDALAYQGNQLWVADTITTSMINPQTGLRQESSLIAQDFEITDNVRYAALLRDRNSMADARLALLEGDWLNGSWCEITLIYKGSDFAFLFAPYLNYQINQRNF